MLQTIIALAMDKRVGARKLLLSYVRSAQTPLTSRLMRLSKVMSGMVIFYLVVGTLAGYLSGGLVWWFSGSFVMGLLACSGCGSATVLLAAALNVFRSRAPGPALDVLTEVIH